MNLFGKKNVSENQEEEMIDMTTPLSKDEITGFIRAELAQALEGLKAPPQPVQPVREQEQHNPYAVLAESFYADPASALQKAAEMQKQDILSQLAPVIMPLLAKQAVERVSEGLGESGKRFVIENAAALGPNPSEMSVKVVREAALRADEQAKLSAPPSATGSAGTPASPSMRQDVTDEAERMKAAFKNVLGKNFDLDTEELADLS